MSEALRTGDLVLCKVGSFAPWPAVVFPQRFLRKDVYRRRRSECVAVCFFNDETYYWDKPVRLKRLDRDMIAEFLENSKGADEDEVLVGAYEEALEYRTLHDFIVQRLEDENRARDWDGSSKIVAGEDPFEGKGVPKTSANAGSAAKPVGKHVRAKQVDNTGGLGSPTVNDTKSIRKKQKLDRSRRIEISLLFRRKLQRNLVQRDTPPSVEELKESHKLLRKIAENTNDNPSFFDLQALGHSKLHKLLKVIRNDDNLQEFHGECNSLLEQWAPLIQELKKDKIKARES